MSLRNDLPITVPMQYVRGVVDAAGQRGVNTTVLLASLGLRPDLLASRTRRVPVKLFSRLYTQVAQALDDEMLGLQTVPVRLGFTEVLCRACLGVETLPQALELFTRIFHVGHGALRLHAESTPAGPVLGFAPAAEGALQGDPVFACQVMLITTYAMLCWLTRQRLPLLGVDLPYDLPPHDTAELGSVFACPIRHGQPEARLQFAAIANEARVMRHATDVPKFMCQAPGSFIEALMQRGRLSVQVRDLLRDALPALPGLDEVAQRLAVSPRTLHRKLAVEGETFQSLKDQLRRDLAVYALKRTQAPLKQIAADLGFADQATFQRAFLQWTGQPPGSYRKAGRSPAAG